MIRRTLIAAASAAFFSSACGGGGDAKPRTVAFFGDSLSYGNIPGGRLAVTPAARLAQVTGMEVRDYTAGAATLREAFGESVPFLDGYLTPDRLPHGLFPGFLASRPADIVLMRYGGADALLATPLAQFSDLYAQAVRAGQAAGCRVVLAGTYVHPEHPRLADFDGVAARVAADTGSVWVDLRKVVPLRYPEDMADGLHGTQETSDRWIAAMGAALKGLA